MERIKKIFTFRTLFPILICLSLTFGFTACKEGADSVNQLTFSSPSVEKDSSGGEIDPSSNEDISSSSVEKDSSGGEIDPSSNEDISSSSVEEEEWKGPYVRQ
jgi:hypothetical protein